MRGADRALKDALVTLQSATPAEFISVDLRVALEEIIGVTPTENILDWKISENIKTIRIVDFTMTEQIQEAIPRVAESSNLENSAEFSPREALRPQLTIVFSPHVWVPILTLALIAFSYTLFVGEFSKEGLLRPTSGAIAFDEAGQSLLHGDVATQTVTDDFIFRGKRFIYNGVFPALLRIAPNSIFPTQFGKWGPLSCLCAALISVFAFYCIARNEFRKQLQGSKNYFWPVFCTVCFAYGTPLTFLIWTPWFYHESILWGLAGFMISLQSMLNVAAYQAKPRDMALVTIGTTIALLSRTIWAIPGLLLLGTHLVRVLVRQEKFVRSSGWIVLFLGVCFQAWINHKRWGSPFTIYRMSYYSRFGNHPEIAQKLAEQGTWNFYRIGTALKNYFIPTWETFSASWPYVHMTLDLGSQVSLYPNGSEPSFPMLLTTGWLIFSSSAVLFVAKTLTLAEFAIVAGATAHAVLVLSYFYIAARFEADLLPILLITSTLVLRKWRFFRSRSNGARILRISFILLCALSCITMLLATVHWVQTVSWDAPKIYKDWLLFR